MAALHGKASCQIERLNFVLSVFETLFFLFETLLSKFLIIVVNSGHTCCLKVTQMDFFYSSGGWKSEMGFIELKLRCWQGHNAYGGSRGRSLL